MAQAFVCLVVAAIVPGAFVAIYGLKTRGETLVLMPDITRYASEHSWFIVLLLVAACVGSLVAVHRFARSTVQCMAVGLCAQALVAWSAMFCFCYMGFTGPMSLHHDSEFEFFKFVSFGAGVFPVTLLLILTPMIVALWPRLISRPEQLNRKGGQRSTKSDEGTFPE
jgi:hypothetical protein